MPRLTSALEGTARITMNAPYRAFGASQCGRHSTRAEDKSKSRQKDRTSVPKIGRSRSAAINVFGLVQTSLVLPGAISWSITQNAYQSLYLVPSSPVPSDLV